MKRVKWHLLLGACLICVSAAAYTLQIHLFNRPQDTYFYLLQDLAFLPIQVSLVTLIINEMMLLREKNALQHKMNMVIGAFFADVGNDLLRTFTSLDSHRQDMCDSACIQGGWADKDFQRAEKLVAVHEYAITLSPTDLRSLKSLMMAQKPYIMNLLSNANLLEHESFTDQMWATSHLAEELSYRTDLDHLPESDIAHLVGDTIRAYRLLAIEWLRYTRHLRAAYPYMYSLILRTQPFDPQANVIVD